MDVDAARESAEPHPPVPSLKPVFGFGEGESGATPADPLTNQSRISP